MRRPCWSSIAISNLQPLLPCSYLVAIICKAAAAFCTVSYLRALSRMQLAVDDFDLVARTPLRLRRLVQHAFLAIVHAHHDLPAVRGFHIAFDLVAGHG